MSRYLYLSLERLVIDNDLSTFHGRNDPYVQTVEAVVGLLTVRQLYLISQELTHIWRITEMG